MPLHPKSFILLLLILIFDASTFWASLRDFCGQILAVLCRLNYACYETLHNARIFIILIQSSVSCMYIFLAFQHDRLTHDGGDDVGVHVRERSLFLHIIIII